MFICLQSKSLESNQSQATRICLSYRRGVFQMFHTSKIANLFYYLTREKQEINFSVFVKTYNISSLNSAKYTKRVFFALLLENFTRFQRYFTYSRLVTCLTYSRSAFSLNYLEQYLRKKYCFRKMQGLFEKSHC